MKLEDLRKEIDLIDKKLIELLALRFQATRQIGIVKSKEVLNSVDNSRYNEIVKIWRDSAIKNNINPDLLEKVFINIHDEVVKEHNQTQVKNELREFISSNTELGLESMYTPKLESLKK